MEMIICNGCGRSIKVVNDIPREDYVRVSKAWGFFSEKDGITEDYVLCEACHKRMTEALTIPPTRRDTVELL
jgi:ribosomal-protein-alanine N-acetyltransferase